MSNVKLIEEMFPDETFIVADGFDDAIIGTTYDSNTSKLRVIYSHQKCIAILMNDMSYEEAIEYFDYNVAGAYIENAPIWMYEIAEMGQ